MSRRVEEARSDAAYPQVRRFGHMLEASLEKPTPPTIVAEKIREIIESGTQKLRHPVGPDAEGFLGWRAAMTDEEWIEWGACPTKRGTCALARTSASMQVPSDGRPLVRTKSRR